MDEFSELQKALNYSFKSEKLLQNALTHTSYTKTEDHHREHNERLEFLGDAVLELAVSDYLYKRKPDMNEGIMTKLRASAVNEKALFAAAKRLGIDKYIVLSKNEDAQGGREKPSIVSDAMEAVIGAVYLDGGFDAAKKLILDSVADFTIPKKDFKTQLQEYVQAKKLGVLHYTLIDERGPDHMKTFTMEVLIDDKVYASGEGSTKQEAGQEAARKTLESIERV